MVGVRNKYRGKECFNGLGDNAVVNRGQEGVQILEDRHDELDEPVVVQWFFFLFLFEFCSRRPAGRFDSDLRRFKR